MKTVLKGTYSEKFLFETLRQGRGRWLRILWCLYAIFAVFFILDGVFAHAHELLPWGVALAFIVCSRRYFIIRRFRSSPLRNLEYTQTITDMGVFFDSASVKSELAWSAFSSAVRRKEGILLRLGKGALYWLPESRITEGSVDGLWATIPEQLKKKK